MNAPAKFTKQSMREWIWPHLAAEGRCMADGCATTCLAPKGHEGAHAYRQDDEIFVSFLRGRAL